MDKPTVFGKYLLIERVSVGGMAEVFKSLAFGPSGFLKTLAIKRVLSSISEDPDFVKMFVDEGNIAGKLHHANIVQIYDLGVIDESYFLAMEFVEGKDMRLIFDRLKKSQADIPGDMAAYVSAQLLFGLDYAHHKCDDAQRPLGIVHRDVSPPNIILSYDGDVKLIDFGIAKAARKASKTQAGILKGKFGYMSPEQVRGMTVDARSDIFSVGVILWEMLAKKRLFVGETDFSTLEKVRGMEIPPPSTHNPDAPKELDGIVLRALERDVSKRYPQAIDMAHDLQRYLYAQPTIFTQTSLAEWMRVHFQPDIDACRETMLEIEKLDFNLLGIDPAVMAATPIRSLKTDAASPSKEEPEEPLLPESGGEREPSPLDGKAPLPISPATWGLVLGGIWLMVLLIGGYHLHRLDARLTRLNPPGDHVPLLLYANQEEATVRLNGAAICTTPCRVVDFPTGRHQVTFEKEGFLPDARTLDLTSKGELPAVLEGRLFRPGEVPAGLILHTDPKDAAIYIDGKKVADHSPAVLPNLKAGIPIQIKAASDGFVDQIQTVTLDREEIRRVNLTLGTATPTLWLISAPAGARLWQNGAETPWMTPVRLEKLEPDRPLTFRLIKEGYEPLPLTLLPIPGREIRLTAELTPLPPPGLPPSPSPPPPPATDPKGDPGVGWITIVCDVQTEVLIDGKPTGAFAPLVNLPVPSGRRTLTLRNRTLAIEDQREVTVQTGQTLRLERRLSPPAP